MRVLEIVQDVSREYLCGKSFANEIPVSSDNEKTALMYATSNKEYELKETNIDDQMLAMFYVRSGEKNEKLSDEEVDRYLGRNWNDFQKFETFIEAVNEIYEIKFATDPNKWKDSTCSCPQNAKRFICKHVLAIAIRMEIINILIIETKILFPETSDVELQRKLPVDVHCKATNNKIPMTTFFSIFR